MVNFTPQSLYLQEITPVPTQQEAGWAPEQVWTFLEKTLLALPGFKPRTVQPVA
jgi:hypothetical protein